MGANDNQVSGDYYKTSFQPWDFIEETGLGYLEGNVVKYVQRWRRKNGLQDLEKARHYLDKLLELAEAKRRAPRGKATGHEIDRFVASNDLRPDEAAVVRGIARWQTGWDLRDVRANLQALFHNASSR